MALASPGALRWRGLAGAKTREQWEKRLVVRGEAGHGYALPSLEGVKG